MRPAASTTPERLNVDALPPSQGMELDYRTELYDDEVKWSPLIEQFLLWTLVGAMAG